jgi:very-short-patch-repair endonuclease
MSSKSKFEGQFRIAWRALADGAPIPEQEYQFHPERKWRFDFAWPAQLIAVEIDGGQWMRLRGGGRHNRDVDREKLNAAAVLGWRILRYSGSMLDDPTAVVNEVLAALNGVR